MMNELTVFNYGENNVRTITKDGEHVIRENETYYTSFEGVCNAVIDRAIGACESLPEVLAALKDVNGFMASRKANAITKLTEMESDDA